MTRTTREVSVNGQAIDTTAIEFDILWLLAKRRGEIVSRDEMYQEIRGIDYNGVDRSMGIHLSRLRRKLKRAGVDTSWIISVRVSGYMVTRV